MVSSKNSTFTFFSLSLLLTFIFLFYSVPVRSRLIISKDDYDDLEEKEESIELLPKFDAMEEKTRNKRYPIHLDPNFSSRIRIQTGECGRSEDGQLKYFCPFPHRGKYSCLEEFELCDGVKNCPDASDENPSNCLFYQVTLSQLHTLGDLERKYDEEGKVRGTVYRRWDPRVFTVY